MSWVCAFQKFSKHSASELSTTQFNLASYNLQVHDHHHFLLSLKVLMSFYLYQNFVALLLAWVCDHFNMVFGLGTRLSVNAFKRTICREVPHLLIKTDSYFAVWSSNPIVCCLMELILFAFVPVHAPLETRMKECQICKIDLHMEMKNHSVG